jgi:hypothetical protein
LSSSSQDPNFGQPEDEENDKDDRRARATGR